MSATVPTGLDGETPDVLGDDASPRREAAATPSAAAPAPATVGRDALADRFAQCLQRGRVQGYVTIALAGDVGADALAPIRAAMGS